MALVKRYQNTLKGRMIVTGNSLMLYQPTGTLAGPFTSTNTALQDGTSPPGTTRTWQSNSSMAVLTIPAGGTVAYAELTWTSLLSGGGFDVSANKNTPVVFKTPTGTTTVAPQVTDDTGTNAIYTRSADVTAVVKAGGSGQYSVGSVAALNGYQVPANGIGWTLTVIVNLASDNFRLFQINIGNQSIGGTATLDFLLTGFSTPATGAVTGRLFMAVQRGDPNVDLANVTVGPSAAVQNLQLTRPPLPSTNLFIGIISNTQTGAVIDTSGTFGNNNNTLSPPAAVSNARFHFDIASFDISSSLTNNQNTLNTRTTGLAANTGFVYNLYNLQVEVQSANLTPITKTVDKAFSSLGDTITYTITFKNTGLVAANNSIFVDTIPNGSSFIANTFLYNGVTITGGNPNPPGINLGDIAPNSAVTISFKTTVTTLPSPNPMVNTAGVGYSFVSAPGLTPIDAFDSSNSVTTAVNNGDLSSTKYVDKAFANIGDILSYTIVLKNVGNVATENVIFRDVTPNGTALVANTFTQNGVTITNPDIDNGVGLSSISIGGTTTVRFKVQIITTPNPNPIPNQSRTIYSYFFSPSQTGKSSDSYSNVVYTQVNNANLGNSIKLTDKSYADCGDTINYTIVVPNTGNVTAQNVIFKDTIPNGTSLVSGTFKVNGNLISGANPSTGVTIPNIAPGTTSTITFSVKVIC